MIIKSNFINHGYSYSYIDELSFYNISLTQFEIFNIMNSNRSINESVSDCELSTSTSEATSLSN